jgi:hypothetical protein
VLAITAVFLDILQYPCSAEIHAQISLACQVHTFERPNGILLALIRDPIPRASRSSRELDTHELATVGEAADDLARDDIGPLYAPRRRGTWNFKLACFGAGNPPERWAATTLIMAIHEALIVRYDSGSGITHGTESNVRASAPL